VKRVADRLVIAGVGLIGGSLALALRARGLVGEVIGFGRRLERFTRSIEKRCAPRADFDVIIKHERTISASLNGRTVMDDKRGRNFFIGSGQQRLF
jgi:nucleoside-diphosphate-sugar epimerase